MEEIITVLSTRIINKNVLIAFLLIFIPNIIAITGIELSYDEAYYWVYSRFLSWGYYDHPPMVALMIRIGTYVFGDTEVGVRFPFTLMQIGTLFLLHKMLKPTSTVIFWALILAMPLFNFSGLVALPDTPLMFFTTCFFYAVKKYIGKDDWRNALLVSLSILGMFYSKYHGLLIVILTTLAYTKFLKRKSFWAIVISVVIFYLPHMYWQYSHDFITFNFHLTKRVEKHFDIMNILNYVFGQIILMGGVLVVIYTKYWRELKRQDPFTKVLIFNSLYFLVFLFFMSFRNQIEANWTISCSIAFILLFYPLLEKKHISISRYAALNVSLVLMVKIFAMTLPFLNLNNRPGRLNELVGWKDRIIPTVLKACGTRKIVGDSYQVSSKISFYTSKMLPAIHLGSRDSQYGLLNLESSIGPNEEICYLTSKKLPEAIKIDTFYKDPVYVLEKTTLNELANRYNTSYEEIIRK